MSGLEAGARVHVEFDAELVNNPDCHGYVTAQWDDPDDESMIVQQRLHETHCTVIVPPIAVGDVVTAENIDQLPHNSIIARPGCVPMTRQYGGWAYWYVKRPSSEIIEVADVNPPVVLRIGSGS